MFMGPRPYNVAYAATAVATALRCTAPGSFTLGATSLAINSRE